MPLFEVVILEKPNKSDAERGVLERLVLGPVTIVARDATHAGYQAVMSPAQPITVDHTRMEVMVRPFK